MKILYLSCHSGLEFDEVKLLHELGHEVFSPGAYVEPANPGDASLRPGIPGLVYNPDTLAAFHALGKPGIDNKELLTKSFVDRFDAVVVMHIPKWITINWEAMKHKTVVWRTIGQALSHQEQTLAPYRRAGMKVIRYSPKERSIPNYLGEDALIRFYKDSTDFGPWNGMDRSIITVCQSMKAREPHCGYGIWEEVTKNLPRKLFGPGNEGSPNNQGKVSFEQLAAAMRDNRAYFSAGTIPASYTLNFMEAWITGIPIVAIGSQLGNAPWWPDHKLYEIPELIENGVTGFVSDRVPELRSYIVELLRDTSLAQKISIAGREQAIKIFGKDTVKEQWKQFLTSL